MVLGGGLLHLKFEPLYYYYSDEDEEMPYSPGEPVWSASYCAVQDSQQHSKAVVLAGAIDNDQGPTDNVEVHPHRGCNATHNLDDPYDFGDDSDDTLEFSNRDTKPYLQVLRTCRQIYLEASRILWTTNTFSFSNPNVMKMFMNDRKTAQKQLLKKMHLDMTWHWNHQKRGWEKGLTLTLVRSLKGLKTFHLDIEQCLLNRDDSRWDGTPDWKTEVLSDSYFEEITKLRILPLETVTVNIINGPMPEHDLRHCTQWPSVGRTEWAERLRSQLLDPDGAARWQEQQDHQKELVRQKKEQEAQFRAKETCLEFSTEEACTESYQKRQDDKDKRTGRVRKEKKVAGPCGRQHMCLVCFWNVTGNPELNDSYEVACNCPRPGRCNEVEDTST